MTKLLSSVGLAIVVATASLAGGCQLYFSDHGNSNGNGAGGNNGPGREPGLSCSGDTQCAAGCFCSDGVCAEGGFCKTDQECGNGFVCDTARASCKPAAQCKADAQCQAGSVCDPASNSCVVTCKCSSDAEAIAQGSAWCDETRNTCMSGADPAGACLGSSTCAVSRTPCPEGQVALVKDGCFTGQCRDIAVCESTPVCGSLQHEDDCDARSNECAPVFVGHNCHGTTCGVSTVDCVCESYSFSDCEASTTATPRIVVGN
jgi:Cys-rich repeat protein